LEKPASIYCGAYRLSADVLRALKGTKGLPEVGIVDVRHKIEETRELAHAALVIELTRVPANIEAVKTKIAILLWNKCTGPFKHICWEDRELTEAHHPSGKMPVGPKGQDGATRPLLARLTSILRFQLDRVIWRILLRIDPTLVDTKTSANETGA
jgi:hypothetical protein